MGSVEDVLIPPASVITRAAESANASPGRRQREPYNGDRSQGTSLVIDDGIARPGSGA